MNVPTLLADIAGLVKNERTDVAVRLAVITSYVSGDLFATVRIGGSISDVRARFINYDPVVGETVQVIQDGLDPIIIGKVGSTGPGLAVPIGAIIGWGNTLPTDWERAEGQPTAGNVPLANVWGANVPDLRYCFIQGAGLGVPVHTRGGANERILNTLHLPSHVHPTTQHNHLIDHNHALNSREFIANGVGTSADVTTGGGGYIKTAGDNTAGASPGVSGNGGADIILPSGSGQPFDIRPIFNTVQYIVKVA